MKKLLLLIAFFCCKECLKSQVIQLPSHSKLYLVRHAEKEQGEDPPLNLSGQKRAGDLVRFLADKGIQRIYVTRFRRSFMTADSLRQKLAIDTVHYLPDSTGEGLMKAISGRHDEGKTLLVIGHSNTIHQLIRATGINDQTIMIPDNEFDNLYIISFEDGKPTLQAMKYGSISGR